MLLTLGHTFETFEDVTRVVVKLHDRWIRRSEPAIMQYAEELDMPPPDDHEPNSKCNIT